MLCAGIFLISSANFLGAMSGLYIKNQDISRRYTALAHSIMNGAGNLSYCTGHLCPIQCPGS